MRMPLASRILFVLVSVVLAVGAHLADYGPSHIFNPLWPPHAKFHTGQTLSFSIWLALLTIYFANRKTTDKTLTVLTTTAFAASYWVTQACAIFYPGTAFADPNFVSKAGYAVLGIPTQLVIDAVQLTLVSIATFLALRPNSKWTPDTKQKPVN